MLIEPNTQENMSISSTPKTVRRTVVRTYSQTHLETARHEAREEALTEFQKILSDNKKYKHLEALFPNRG